MVKVITPPTIEPATVDEAKAQAVIGHNADDLLLALLIGAARENGEALTGRSWAEKTLEVVLDAFPSWEIELPQGPVTDVVSVKYIDVDGDEQTLTESTDYEVDTDSLVALISPVFEGEWPETKNTFGAVRIRYEAGWARSDFPLALKQWLLIRVASMYAQKENHVAGPGMLTVMEMGRGFADSLLDGYRVQESC